MRLGTILAALGLAGCAQQPVSPISGAAGIVSTNPCADAILVGLVRPDRITAISHYSQDADATSLPLEVARRFRTTNGTAEEVIALHPALVLADIFAPAATLAAYRRAGLRVVELGSPISVAASIGQIRQIAAAVGEAGRGAAMIAQIEQAVGRARPAHRRALFYIAGDLASGGGNLLDELMRNAGMTNAAAAYGLSYSGTIPIEALLAQPPDVIISTGVGRSAALRHRLLPGVRTARFPRTLINCGGPSIPPALARLRAIGAGR